MGDDGDVGSPKVDKTKNNISCRTHLRTDFLEQTTDSPTAFRALSLRHPSARVLQGLYESTELVVRTLHR
jgi:hypothetical protein